MMLYIYSHVIKDLQPNLDGSKNPGLNGMIQVPVLTKNAHPCKFS